MTRFEHWIVAGSLWIVDRLLRRAIPQVPIVKGSGGPHPGHHWRAFDVEVREQRLHGATIYAWTKEHAERKVELLWGRGAESLRFDWTQIETLDVTITEA